MADEKKIPPHPNASSDPATWLEFVGLIPKDDLKLMEEAIHEAMENVSESDW